MAARKRPVQLDGSFGIAVRKRGTLDAKGYAIDIAIIAKTKTGREVALVMDSATFKKFVIDATSEMYRCEFGEEQKVKRVDGLAIH